jgi:hypothetical protein
MNQHIPRRVAIWIDHQSAILIMFGDNRQGDRTVIASGADPHIRSSGSYRPHEAHRRETLRHFYKAVARRLDPGDMVVILGPGPCKYELRRHIERHEGLAGRVVALIGAPRLTDAELLARAETMLNTLPGAAPAEATAMPVKKRRSQAAAPHPSHSNKRGPYDS